MARYTVWYEGEGKYSIIDIATGKAAVGPDGKPLTKLSFKQATDLAEQLKE